MTTRIYSYTMLIIAVLGSSTVASQSETNVCEELVTREGARLEDALAAGCVLSAEQISNLMDNPVGEVISAPLQFDRLSVTEPVSGKTLTIETIKLIPTFPIRTGDNWSLVNRVVVPFVKVPVGSVAPAALGTRPDAGIIDGTPDNDPFTGSTSGLSDLTYVGLFTPRDTKKIKNGKLIWAIGPTIVLPTAVEDILGQGKYQLGPAFALGYLGERWTLGTLAQHWWSVAGDDDRSSVNQSNLQYFYYYKLPNQWAIGASPSISIDWTASGGPTINAPIGIGINKTFFIGKLPVRIGLETTHYLQHESAVEPDWGVRLSITPAIPSAFLSQLGL